MNKAEVQWSFRGISTPIGVATYNNIRIKDALPTQEQLKERMELLQREMRATKRLMKGKKIEKCTGEVDDIDDIAKNVKIAMQKIA